MYKTILLDNIRKSNKIILLKKLTYVFVLLSSNRYILNEGHVGEMV